MLEQPRHAKEGAAEWEEKRRKFGSRAAPRGLGGRGLGGGTLGVHTVAPSSMRAWL